MYSSYLIIRVINSQIMRLVGNATCMGEMRNAHNILAGKPYGKRLLERPEHRWEDMDLKEILCEGVNGFV
jgi:hypothetical protein